MSNLLVEKPATTAELYWLLEAATGRSRRELVCERGDLDDAATRRALALAERWAAGEPLQYVVGLAGFRRLELEVGPGVFIPRPETELVAERALARLPHGGVAVDVGTGSGALALALADERPDAVVWATETSPEALAWARKNQELLGLDVELVECDLLGGLPERLRGAVDVIVSNPPYVATLEAGLLDAEVRDHEPDVALFGGTDGLRTIETLVWQALSWLRRAGWLVLEIGERQASSVHALLQRAGYVDVSVSKDLAGRDRIAEARRAP